MTTQGVRVPEPGQYRQISRPYERRFRYVYRQHVFDKLRSVDLNLTEFQHILGVGEVIAEAIEGPDAIKELILLVNWLRPLHVVIVVDESRQEERLVTVYEPTASEWTLDLRRRR